MLARSSIPVAGLFVPQRSTACGAGDIELRTNSNDAIVLPAHHDRHVHTARPSLRRRPSRRRGRPGVRRDLARCGHASSLREAARRACGNRRTSSRESWLSVRDRAHRRTTRRRVAASIRVDGCVSSRPVEVPGHGDRGQRIPSGRGTERPCRHDPTRRPSRSAASVFFEHRSSRPLDDTAQRDRASRVSSCSGSGALESRRGLGAT